VSERELGEPADVRLEGPLDLRRLRLPPGLVRHTVTIEAGGSLCADGAAWCGELIGVDEGAIEVVSGRGATQRLGVGALLFVAGLGDVELRCVGPTPAVLTGLRRASDPATGSAACDGGVATEESS
jgi:hypothetical protein